MKITTNLHYTFKKQNKQTKRKKNNNKETLEKPNQKISQARKS